MIGAMPAVAVRHERRKREPRNKRPSQLGIQSPPGTGDSLDNMGIGSPEPLQSPPQRQLLDREEYYVCGKVSVLHVVVVSLLLGAILVIVGLVQLTPGADASQHRYLLLGGGGALLLLGVLLAALRCCVLPWRARRLPVRGPGHAPSHAPGHAPGAGTEASASVRDGNRSRTNSATNGQVARRASSALGASTPTAAHRRRSLLELERGLAGMAASLEEMGDVDAEEALSRAEIQNHLNELTQAAPAELAAITPAVLIPPAVSPSATGPETSTTEHHAADT